MQRLVRLLLAILLIASMGAFGIAQEEEDEGPEIRTFNALETWEPITQERLLNPTDGEWLHFRRTVDSLGYSPLDQINVENVSDLEPVWAWSPGDTERWEPFPSVVNGVMFITEGRSRVHALDAATGEVLWSYIHDRPEDVELSQAYQRSRGVSFYEDLVLYPTADMKLVALDARTGEVEWEIETGDYTLGYGHTSPPLVVGNRAFIGSTGGERGAQGFVAAIDVEEGELLWRTLTAPNPDDPAADSWVSTPLCAAAWYNGSFDPERNVLYQSTGQPCPWNIAQGAEDVESLDELGDRLYSNSILAFDADTGEILWHFAHNPLESWDHDSPYENVLTELEIDGEMRDVLVHTGKSGWGIVLDRETGEFLDAWEFARQNAIEGYTDDGRVQYNEEKLPWPPEEWLDTENTVTVCPDSAGVRNVGATSFNPETGLLYIPTIEMCGDFSWRTVELTPGEWNNDTTGTSISNRRLWEDQDFLGQFVAMNVATGERAWEYRVDSGASFVSSALSTGGGIVFAGSADRWLVALDAASGDELWKTRLNGDVTAGPITYEVDGRQYVAVPSGGCGLSFCQRMDAVMPDVHVPEGDGVMWVFALPE